MRLVLSLGLVGLLSVVLPPSVESAKAAPSVRVASRAEIRGPVVRLGDVAKLSGFTPEATARFSEIELGAAPGLGTGRLLPRAFLLSTLRENGFGPSVRFDVPPRLELTRAHETLLGRDLMARIEAVARAAVPPDVELASLVVPLLSDQLVPAGASVNVRILGADRIAVRGADRIATSPLAAEVVIRDGEEIIRTQKVVLKVDAVAETWVLVAGMKRGQTLSASDVRTLRLPASLIPQDVVRSASELEGAVLRRDLEPDQPIAKRNIELPQLISRGERVTMIARRGALRISVMGEALGGGRFGDTVKMKNLDSLRVVAGRVIGPQTIETEF